MIGKAIFVLPAFNEQEALGSLLDRIRSAMEAGDLEYRVVVVDDGSSDGTEQVARLRSAAMPLVLLSHPVNQGLGVALRTGLREACTQAQAGDFVVTMDADDTHDPGAVPALLCRRPSQWEVLVASRYGPGSGEIGVSRLRRLCSRSVCGLLKAIFPIQGIRDYSSGYRIYRAEVLHRCFAQWGDGFISEAGFTCMAEVLLKLRRLEARIEEAGVPLRYDRKKGDSKMRVASTIGAYLMLIGRELGKAGKHRVHRPKNARRANLEGSIAAKR